MKKILLSITAALLSITAFAQENPYDQNKPFGFCTRSSRTDASSTFEITGGGCYTYPVEGVDESKVKVLTSSGQDMKGTIQNAIKQYDVIILDGSDGDFIVSQPIGFERGNKTILGINNARLCTQWYLTEEDRNLLDNAVDPRTPDIKGVTHMSTKASDNLGGTVNGNYIKEQAEYMTRKTLFEKYGNENYRNAGIFSLNKENVIIRNITFVGPGSVDVGGADLISATGAKHCWIDHCVFMDGTDGNFDITQQSDFNTVSWCVFRYTDRSYVHMNTNLVGSDDDYTSDSGKLNTTFAFNWWAPGCNQRMPMARYGKIHMLNNYYSCSGASLCMNPRKNSEFLIEGNYFTNGVNNPYKNNDATAVTWADNNIITNTSVSKPSSFGNTVTVPYTYTVATAADVPTTAQVNCGATLQWGSTQPTEGVTGNVAWGQPTADQAGNISQSFTDYIENSIVTLGSNLTNNGTVTSSGITFSKFTATTPVTSASENDIVCFSLTTKSGYKFKATKASFYVCKIATDNGNFDAKWIDGGGEKELITGATPSRNNKDTEKGYNYYTEYLQNLTLLSTETDGTCTLKFYLYNVGFIKEGVITKKDMGLASVVISGVITNAATGISVPVSMSVPVDNTYYNLKGQRVAKPTKGLYIVNGKKVFIK